MDGGSSTTSDAATIAEDNTLESLISGLLAPGSSLNPTFLLILDIAFAALLLVFIALLVITHWNTHLSFLIIIEVCLWASVKWFVAELRKIRPQEAESKDKRGTSPKATKHKED